MIDVSRLSALGFKSTDVKGATLVNKGKIFEYRDGAIFSFTEPKIVESKTRKGVFAVLSDTQPIYIGSLCRSYNLVDASGKPTGKSWIMDTTFGKAAADCLTADDFCNLLRGKSIKVSKEKVAGIPTFAQNEGKWSVSGCKTALVTVFEWAQSH